MLVRDWLNRHAVLPLQFRQFRGRYIFTALCDVFPLLHEKCILTMAACYHRDNVNLGTAKQPSECKGHASTSIRIEEVSRLLKPQREHYLSFST